MSEKLGLIAGNGRFPFLILDAAKSRGYEVVVAAIKEETFPEIEQHGAASVHWMSLGELVEADRDFQSRGREDGGDGRAGEAQADIQLHSAGLEIGEAAAVAADCETRIR